MNCLWLGVVDDDEGVVLAWAYESDGLGLLHVETEAVRRLGRWSEHDSKIVPIPQHNVLVAVRPSSASSLAFCLIGAKSQVLDLHDFLRHSLVPFVASAITQSAVMDKQHIIANQAKLHALVNEVILQGRIDKLRVDSLQRHYQLALSAAGSSSSGGSLG
ncbi:hypothetical protein BASA81_004160 [Batrachochytrium salamandrivorans]|nr:hypothetical protein BASA81_004160 [Batrachochytrium salamandrivorans]